MTNDEKLVNGITKDYLKYYKDHLKIDEQVAQSKAIYKGAPVPYLYVPKFVTKKQLIDFNQIVKDIFNLVNKTIDLYKSHQAVRDLYNFDPRLEELILLESPYEARVPMGRFDLFYYGIGDYKFCELNTDGSSAMNEDMVLSGIISNSQLLNALREDYDIHSFELFDTWVQEVNNIVKESGRESDNLHLCILDFIKDKPSVEFLEFKKAFEKSGYHVTIADPRNLTYESGHLYVNNHKIDVIYRRLVTKDLMEHYDEIPNLIEGLLANNTLIIGNIRSQVVHTKMFFKVLHDKAFQKYLNKDEIDYINKHIPYTKYLTEIKDKYLKDKERYIVKPMDSYASKGVFCGKDYSVEVFKEKLSAACNAGYLIQEYCKPAETQNILFKSESSYEVPRFRNITGLFVYNESLYGIYSRLGLNPIISGLHDGYTVPTFYIGEK